MISTREKRLGLELGVRVLISALVLSGISALYVYMTLRIALQRRGEGIALGNNGDVELERKIRGQGRPHCVRTYSP